MTSHELKTKIQKLLKQYEGGTRDIVKCELHVTNHWDKPIRWNGCEWDNVNGEY
jgi:hypothetical protein